MQSFSEIVYALSTNQSLKRMLNDGIFPFPLFDKTHSVFKDFCDNTIPRNETLVQLGVYRKMTQNNLGDPYTKKKINKKKNKFHLP